ncbi:ABC transporter ATP-binding protein [Tissierella carlieri]|uniref:ABC transporter ATP-binding protein n=1 Tax=Tissierella carlieri TaxID=689904 RepID=A0ABT1SF97_9FIRM|nr:ABC transporter ATP-binding protein [Tissierella carlieri]MCQ4925168.1 ABC transporter ATP-binding protein [Tissierella carlieri]
MHDIKVENIMFSYDKEPILENINMKIEAGDFVCLLGQSGCGKSTFLRLMAGLSEPDSGTIFVGDNPLQGASLDRGVVFQDYSLFPWLTTGKNIVLSLQQKFKNESKKDLKKRALYYLKKVGLEESTFDKYPNELSGGMRQRSAICRSFALDPPILLMDEPFGALDAVTRAKLQDMVLDLWRKDKENRKTILFVTHDVDEALLLSTKIFVFGSSPSKIIYTHSFKDEEKADRDSLFKNEEALELRNKLIHIINRDIEEKLIEGR